MYGSWGQNPAVVLCSIAAERAMKQVVERRFAAPAEDACECPGPVTMSVVGPVEGDRLLLLAPW